MKAEKLAVHISKSSHLYLKAGFDKKRLQIHYKSERWKESTGLLLNKQVEQVKAWLKKADAINTLAASGFIERLITIWHCMGLIPTGKQ